MANQKISQFVAASVPLVGNEMVPVVQDGVNRRAAARAFDREIIQMACSDLETPLQAAEAVNYVRAARAFQISDIRASLLNASASGAVQIDIRKNGSSILSSPLTIDQGNKTSVGSQAPVAISDSDVADDDELIVDISEPGTDASGLVITIIGTPT